MGLSGLVLFVFLAASCLTSLSAAAQGNSETVVSVDAGAVRIQQRSRESSSSGVAALAARHATRRFALSAGVLAFQSNDSAGAIQASLGAEALLPRLPFARVEASATTTTFGTWGDRQGRSQGGYIRPQFAREQFGLYGTLGAGSVKRDVGRFHALDWDAGAWIRKRVSAQGSLSLNVALRQAFTNDYPLIEDMGFVLLDTNAYHYAVRDLDATVTSRWKRIELQLNGVLRNGIESTRGRAGALNAAATVDLTSRFALTINAGEQLADVRTGVPTARLYGASLRWNAFRGASSPAAVARTAPKSPLATEVVRRPEGGATVRVRVNAAADARVELTGSFNDWAPLQMTRVGDVFELTIELPRGTHRVAVRVNGGSWQAPVGLARMKDDLGGEAGLVVVP